MYTVFIEIQLVLKLQICYYFNDDANGASFYVSYEKEKQKMSAILVALAGLWGDTGIATLLIKTV